MGLYGFEVKIIAGLVSSLEDRKPLKVLSYGHPDILATPKELRFLGLQLESLPDGERLDRPAKSYDQAVVGSAHRLFKAMGASLTVADILSGYGIDVMLDLNRPAVLSSLYDLVIDPGTSEHCFNVGQALVNMANSVKPCGYIYHMVPLCHWNHGFWNFSPCAFSDFYEQNGFRIERIEAEYRGHFQPVRTREKFEIPNRGRKHNLMCIAKRMEGTSVGFPTQYKWHKPKNTG